MKIISGCCTGADLGGLDAAVDMGIETGGWVWHGDLKNHPEWVEKYGVVEVTQGENRTWYNATYSDATLHFKHGGEKVTHYALQQSGKGWEYYRPYFEVKVEDYENPIDDEVIVAFREWLVMEQPQVLNIAGNADHRMYTIAHDFLTRALIPLLVTDVLVTKGE